MTLERTSAAPACGERGYAMAALLVGMAVMAIMMSVALPVWRTAVTREREAELVFRGEQYAHAIELFSRRTGGFPTSLDMLEKGRFIRKLYKDPMTGEGDFQPVYLGQVLPGQTSAPVQPGRGGVGGSPAGVPAGRAGQAPGAAGLGTSGASPLAGAGGSQSPGQPGAIGGGPIIGVVSKSKAESMRLYNDRGHYNEWAFVAVTATTQAGARGGGQNPGGGRGAELGVPGRGGRGADQGGRGRGGRGADQGGPGRGGPGRFGPGSGEPPAGRGFPGRGLAPGNGSPSGFPTGFPFPGGQQPGRQSQP